MEELVKRLQEEAGLTQEQAIDAVAVLKNYMDSEEVEVDWDKFFKQKLEDLKEKSTNLYNNASKQTQGLTDKVINKVDELADKARKGAHDISQKAADFFDDK